MHTYQISRNRENLSQPYAEISNIPAPAIYLSNLTGTLLAHPMDVMRVNAQANAMHYISLKRISQIMMRQKGITGFYYGAWGATGRCTVQSVTQYVFYNYLKHSPYILMLQPYDTYTVWGISGLGAGFISTPFAKYALIRQADLTRYPYQRRNLHGYNFMHAFRCMYSRGGLPYLFAGSKLQALSGCALALLHEPIYDTVQEVLIHLHNLEDRTWEISLISLAITGSILSLLLTPLDAIKTLMMNAGHQEFKSSRHLIMAILRKHGYQGFFLGLTPALVGILPHSIVATITYYKMAFFFENYFFLFLFGNDFL